MTFSQEVKHKRARFVPSAAMSFESVRMAASDSLAFRAISSLVSRTASHQAAKQLRRITRSEDCARQPTALSSCFCLMLDSASRSAAISSLRFCSTTLYHEPNARRERFSPSACINFANARMATSERFAFSSASRLLSRSASHHETKHVRRKARSDDCTRQPIADSNCFCCRSLNLCRSASISSFRLSASRLAHAPKAMCNVASSSAAQNFARALIAPSERRARSWSSASRCAFASTTAACQAVKQLWRSNFSEENDQHFIAFSIC
mmetsp:Transcript_23464/g.67905  ORF Transcript_23464/g.67905 Transcript_23464/m.67905 type:complete len:266 (+) Transcript_23464:499-1296(+)